jgi:hypothetical protein
MVCGALARAREGPEAEPEHATPTLASNAATVNRPDEIVRFIH